MVTRSFAPAANLAELRQRHRRYVLGALTLVLVWWLVLVVAAGWAPDLLATRIAGTVNLGMLFLLGQLISTLAVTQMYLRYARARLDPLAEAVRADPRKDLP
jgi:uncharacterized membrane protein (DUF485 family)